MARHNEGNCLYQRGGRWCFKQRVPRRFERPDPRRPVRIALRTDSEREAPGIAAGLWACWEALEAGNTTDAKAGHYATLKLAEAHGFTCRPATDLAAGDFEALHARVESPVHPGGAVAIGAEPNAALGLVASPRPRLSEVLEDFVALTSDRLKGKNEGQIRRWKNVRIRSVANMTKVFGDKPINQITCEDAVAFRT
ncbi:DUF6538 domain-containing protein [Amaricoccus solimangrovi]|uniref:DUF6538 domain-containing protein n=1 Tax=Amaricoccus solimangrovi TaxID=2589815 RepID=A0A501WW72_9RHOB|nr:DUF6538 domain-containing protein [Amaricoccus solimangrovi]TPE50136.1 hypothetical protein FJM51_12150 [Amaricoccus solimangrovi]